MPDLKRRVWLCCESYPCVCGMNTGNVLDTSDAPSPVTGGGRNYEICLLTTDGNEVAASDYVRLVATIDSSSDRKGTYPFLEAQSDWGIIDRIVVILRGDPVTKPARVFKTTHLRICAGTILRVTLNFADLGRPGTNDPPPHGQIGNP